MATDVSNGKGGVIDVTATAQQILIVPLPTNGGGNNEYAKSLKVWNTGTTNVVYAAVNQDDGDFTEATAVPIPPESDFWFVGGRKPIKSLVLKCATGETSTANYGAF